MNMETAIGAPVEKNETTLKQMDEMVSRCFLLKERKKQLSDQEKQVGRELLALQEEVRIIMEDMDLDTYQSSAGKFTPYTQTAISVPKDDDNREKLRAYLEEIGAFETMWTVNSKTMNSFNTAEAEKKEVDGEFDFIIPGLIEGGQVQRYTMTKAKKKA